MEEWLIYLYFMEQSSYIFGASYMLSIEPKYCAGSKVEKTIFLFNDHSRFALSTAAKLLVAIEFVIDRNHLKIYRQKMSLDEKE